MSGFESKIISDSINPGGNRVTTFLLTYPRFIHSEILTHRMLSRNSASSRAIPIKKIVEQVLKNPAIPVRWGKNGKGMQDHGQMFHGEELNACRFEWYKAAERASSSALFLESMGLHKQITNRILEPFVWMTTLVTATEWENFFSLRLHKDAQPEFQHLAYIMLKSYLTNQPELKQWGEWHIPFGDKIESTYLVDKLKVATARAARTSYLTLEKESSLSNDIALHDRLVESGHWSPFEHSCQAHMGWSANFNGWIQYRKSFISENRKCNLNSLLKEYEDSLSV